MRAQQWPPNKEDIVAKKVQEPAPRCTAQITIPDGVQRGERGQCMKKAVKGYEHCATHRKPWDRPIAQAKVIDQFTPGFQFPQYMGKGAAQGEVVEVKDGLVHWRYVGTTEVFATYATVLAEGMTDRNAGNIPLDGGY